MMVNAPGRQRGAVLVVSLVLLVVLTLLGVSVMNVTQLEERMAGNSQEMNQAFHSAETGLSSASTAHSRKPVSIWVAITFWNVMTSKTPRHGPGKSPAPKPGPSKSARLVSCRPVRRRSRKRRPFPGP